MASGFRAPLALFVGLAGAAAGAPTAVGFVTPFPFYYGAGAPSSGGGGGVGFNAPFPFSYGTSGIQAGAPVPSDSGFNSPFPFAYGGAGTSPGAVAVEVTSNYRGSGKYDVQFYDAVRDQWDLLELRKRSKALGLEEAIRIRTQPTPLSDELPTGRDPKQLQALIDARYREIERGNTELSRADEATKRKRARNRKRAAQIMAYLK